jgi:hypothetical protein
METTSRVGRSCSSVACVAVTAMANASQGPLDPGPIRAPGTMGETIAISTRPRTCWTLGAVLYRYTCPASNLLRTGTTRSIPSVRPARPIQRRQPSYRSSAVPEASRVVIAIDRSESIFFMLSSKAHPARFREPCASRASGCKKSFRTWSYPTANCVERWLDNPD